MTSDTETRKLEARLRDMRESLRRGQIDAVAGQAAAFEDIAQRVEQLPLSSAQARTLRQEAGALEGLLRAAMDGIRAAHRRIEALQTAHGGLDSYDRCGRALRIGTAPPKAARRV